MFTKSVLTKSLPAALGLWISVSGVGSLSGQEVVTSPGPLSPNVVEAAPVLTNQQTAEAIAASLRHSGMLRNYRVDVSFTDGIAHLTGFVQDQAQRDDVMRIVQAVSGVREVRERLKQVQIPEVRPVQAQGPEGFTPPPPAALPQPPLPPPQGGYAQEPLSIMPPMMAPGANAQMQPPPMPPYAWPTYAPYNNFSRVAQPQLYPYEQFPFIGPMYPFPKIPPGWRGISLRWYDGYWWYGREACGHDWWRVRYW